MADHAVWSQALLWPVYVGASQRRPRQDMQKLKNHYGTVLVKNANHVIFISSNILKSIENFENTFGVY